MIIKNVLDIGTAPTFIELSNYVTGSNTFVKLEGLNIGASIKLKAAKFMYL